VAMQMRVALGRDADGVVLYSYQKPAYNLSASADFLGFLGSTIFSPSYVLPSYLRQAILETAPTPAPTPSEVVVAANLPPPLPLEEPAPAATPTPRAYTQLDAVRALLGSDVAEAPAAAPAREARSEPAARPLPELPVLAVTRWYTVTLKSGKQFVAARVSGDDETSVFKTRGWEMQLTLRNSDIAEVVALEP